jgi:hypothetical protein
MHIQEDGWLEDGNLPSNQLPLLRSMLGRHLINIQRSLSVEAAENNRKGQDFFRKSLGTVVVQLEGLPLIYIDDYRYYKQERSIDVSLELPGFGGWEYVGWGRRFTLHDRDYVDDRLHSLMGQRLMEMYILIRKHELRGDQYRALQDSLQMTFENGTTIILCYFLGSEADDLHICYPEEVRWDAVRYKINVARGRFPSLYRFNRWKWRFMYYLGERYFNR